MKTMKFSRAVVALLLVCALLFSWSPVKAHAVDPVTATVGVLALSLAASVLIGCGIQLGSELGAFEALANSLVGAWEAAGWVKDNVVDVYFKDGFTYVPSDLIGFTKDWLWGEGSVLVSMPPVPVVSAGTRIQTSSSDYVVASCDLYVFGWMRYSASSSTTGSPGYTSFLVPVSNSSFSFTRSNGYTVTSIFCSTNGNYYYSFDNSYPFSSVDGPCLTTSQGYAYGGTGSSIVDAFRSGSISEFGDFVIGSDLDIVIGDVASADQDIATGYPEWAGQAVALTPSGTDTVITGYPVSTPATYEEAITQTQTEAQSGTTSITDSDIGSDVVVEGLDVPLAEVNTISFIDALGLSDLLVTMQALPQALGTTFTDALTAVFVPSADYLTAKVEALRSRFGFIESVVSTGEFLRDSVSGASGPPVIYVDLGAADGNINYGGKVLLTDFSWYEPYKPTVDSVLGAACWAFFGWRVFMRLPGIIGGESGYVESAISLYDFHKSARDNDSPKKKKGG